jgi:hypothetical protein
MHISNEEVTQLLKLVNNSTTTVPMNSNTTSSGVRNSPTMINLLILECILSEHDFPMEERVLVTTPEIMGDIITLMCEQFPNIKWLRRLYDPNPEKIAGFEMKISRKLSSHGIAGIAYHKSVLSSIKNNVVVILK